MIKKTSALAPTSKCILTSQLPQKIFKYFNHCSVTNVIILNNAPTVTTLTIVRKAVKIYFFPPLIQKF